MDCCIFPKILPNSIIPEFFVLSIIPKIIPHNFLRPIYKSLLQLYIIPAILSSLTVATTVVAMVSVKQLVFPNLIFAAVVFSTQGEQKSVRFYKPGENHRVVVFFQARIQFQGEALFVWYATGGIFLHTPLDECRYTSPDGDTFVMMPISV